MQALNSMAAAIEDAMPDAGAMVPFLAELYLPATP